MKSEKNGVKLQKSATVVASKHETKPALAESFTNQKTLIGLRKGTRVVGLVGIIVMLITVAVTWAWLLIAFGAYSGTDNVMKAIGGITSPLSTVAKYAMMVSGFIALALACLLAAHSIISGIKLRKNNLRKELPTVALNGVVAILMLVFFIVLIVNVFGDGKFLTVDEWTLASENKKIVLFGTKTHNCILYLGLLFALVVYCDMFAKTFNKRWFAKADTNSKMQRTLAMTAGGIAISLFLPVILTILGGFVGEYYSQTEKVLEVLKSGFLWSGVYVGQFVTPCLIIVALATLFQIGLIFLKNDKNKLAVNCTVWGVLGVLVLVFFIINAVFFKFDWEMISTTKWFEEDGAKTCSIMALIGWIAALGTGVYSMIRAKNFIPVETK